MHVHISNLAAQTGASLFLHTHAPPYHPALLHNTTTTVWIYDKREHLSFADLTRSTEITHLIAEADGLSLSSIKGWTAVAIVDGFDGWRLNRGVKHAFEESFFERLKGLGNALQMERSGKLVILKRSG